MSAAEGVLTLTALFQDNATAGLKDFTAAVTAATTVLTDAASRLTPFNQALGVTSADVRTTAESFIPFNTTMTTVGATAAETVGRLSPLGTAFVEIGATSKELVGGLGPLGAIFTEVGAQAGAAAERMQTLPATETEIAGATRGLGGALTTVGEQFTTAGTEAQVAGTRIQDSQAAMNVASEGGLTLKNTLVGLGTEYQNVTTQANNTGAAHVGLGTKIGLVGGFIGATASSVFSLVTDYTQLEGSAIRVDRAHVMVAASAHTVTVATDAYNVAVAKYGPNSEQARVKLEALDVAQMRYGVNLEREQQAQKTYNEKLVEFGMNAVQVVSNIALLGSTLTVLKTNMGLTSLATTANTEANIANRASMLGLVGTAGPLGAAFKSTTAAEGEATLATRGLGLSFLEIAGPIVAAVGLFLLIETNTFGMGDAFRSTTTVIAQSIDAIVNEVHVLWNGFVEFLNNLAGFQAEVHNQFTNMENGIITAFNGIIDAAVSFVNNVTSTLVNIYNFFVNSVVNPIINAWNQGMRALIGVVAEISSTIIGAFGSLFEGVVQTIHGIVDKINGALALIHLPGIDVTPLIKLQESITNTGTTAEQFNKTAQAAFIPAPGIKTSTEQVTQLHASHLQLVGGLENVSQAQHTFDGSMVSTNTHIAEGIANVVNYYSHGQNLANLLQSQLPPPLKNLIELLIQQGGAFATNIEKMLGMGQATQTESAATTASTSAHQKHNEVLSAAAVAEANYTKAISDAKSQLVDQTTKEIQTTTATMQLASANAFAAKGVADAAKAYADAEAKLQAYLGELQSSTAVMNLFQSGVVTGKEKLLEFAAQAVTTGAADQAYGEGLTQVADKLGFLKSGLQATTQNEEDWIKATNGGTQALEATKKAVTDLIGGFFAFGDAINKTLGDAMTKGTKDFDKSLQDLATQTGISFDTLKNDMGLKVAAGMSQAVGYLQSGLGVMVDDIKASGHVNASAMEQNIAAISQAIQGASPQVIAAWNKVFADMRAIAAEPIPTAASIGKLQTDMLALNGVGVQQEAIFAALPSKYQGAASAAGTLSAAVQTVISGYQAMGEKVNTVTGIVTTASGEFVGKLNLQTGAMNTTGTAANSLATQLQQLTITRILSQATQEYTTDLDTLARALATANTDATLFSGSIQKNSNDIGVLNNDLSTSQKDVDNLAQATTQGTNDFNSFNRTVNTVGQTVNTTNADVARFATGMSALNRAADSALNTINTDFGAIERSINTDMTSAARDVQTQTNIMINAFNTAFSNIVRTVSTDMNNMLNDVNNRGSAIIREFQNIGSSASSQVGRVNQLASSINALHDKTVTITTRFVTIGSPPAAVGFASPISNNFTPAIGASGPTTQALTVNQPVVVQGGQNNNQPIIIQIDGQVLGRALRKNILGLSAGGMT